MRKLSLILIVLMVLPLLQVQASTPAPAVESHSVSPSQSTDTEATPTNRIIIKYKSSANLTANAPASADRMSALSAAAGVPLTYFREMSGDAHVLSLSGKLPVSQVQAIAARLMTLSDVEYAEPDYVLHPTLSPNDPMYSQQWHYFETYGINAPAAWDITTGSASIVVAVIDTGITDHSDLAGRTVGGYDFISDAQVANDGDGRDSNPHDPGDWITSAESSSGYFAGCTVTNSSWHGTHVAGTIGAASNNSLGVTGINWVSKILPVRVLGKCGGYTSDIVDGMRWAAGLTVSGVPANANPAKVENMSLGGSGACSTTQQNAINEITAAGTTVIVAAGNSNANASGFQPANCNNVITVAATDRDGNRAYYSNYGSLVEIAAPGGDTRYSGDGVLSTLNSGTTTPSTESYAFYQGTSMATPHVVGVASLLYSLVPSLTPAQVLQILQSTVTPFPGGSTCTTSICGAGIVNAGAAVRAVAYDVGIQKQVLGSDLKPGDRITFTLSISNSGAVAAAGIVVTDIVPSQVLAPTFGSNIPITRTGVLTYVWNVGTLGVGQSGVITVYGQIDPALPNDFSFVNTASISAQQDSVSSNNSSSVTVGGYKVYMPLIVRDWPPVPAAPVLNAISNADGDGNYAVSWNAAARADTYTLQEDDNTSFSSPTAVYGPGATLSWSATSKSNGTYYYRVKATNSYGDSAWSNTQSVLVQPTSGPTPGFWQDTTYGDEFYVSSDRATVDNFAIYVNVTGCGTLKITRITAIPISSGSFSFSGSFYASGTFDSSTSAHGTDGLNNYYSSLCGAYLTGGPWDWTATWQHSLASGPAGQSVSQGITETLVDVGEAHQVNQAP